MTGQRVAGYCQHCNRGVSIVRPQATGLMEKMKSALSQADDDSNWVCTKCGNPATRGFAPPPAEGSGAPDDTPSSETREDLQPPGQEKTAIPEEGAADTRARADIGLSSASLVPADGAVTSDTAEATCHLCGQPVPFGNAAGGDRIDCPQCHQPVILPDTTGDSSALTTSPGVIKLDDLPDRPDISKALCAQCNFEMTYPKRLTGKNVECPSCASGFSLP